MKERNQRRPNIGFFVAELEGEYCSELCKGAHDAAEELDANLIIFPGKAIASPYKYQYQLNIIYDLVDGSNLDGLIVSNTILNFYLKDHSLDELYRNYKPLPIINISFTHEDMPGILINNKAGLYQGLVHLIKTHHKKRIAFIRGPETNNEAEERYSVYLKALEDNHIPLDESIVYLGDFSNYSAAAAIHEFLDMRKVEFDSLAAANDEMALKAMELMIARGIKVPEEVAVLGFDDVDGAKLSIPSLTTVRQPVYDMGWKAMETVVKVVGGTKSGNVILDTSLVIRESCGCMAQSGNQARKKTADLSETTLSGRIELLIQSGKAEKEKLFPANTSIDMFARGLTSLGKNKLVEREEAHEILSAFSKILHESDVTDESVHFLQDLVKKLRAELTEHINEAGPLKMVEDLFQDLKDLLLEGVQQNNAHRWSIHHTDIRVLRSILEMMVLNLDNKKELFSALNTELKVVAIQNCFVFLYDREIPYERDTKWVPPVKVYLAMACDKSGVISIPPENTVMNYNDILRVNYFSEGPRYSLVLNPITFMQDQMGFVFCDFIMRDFYLYETLFIEVSCAIKLYFLLNYQEQIQRKLRMTLNELEDSNRKLNFLSQTDELTGLYNRRGFLKLATQNLDLARNMNKNGMLFFADLDGLKKINDTYGHEEGDYAIRQTAIILKKTFRNADILSRLGGDEFTVFTVDTDPSMQDMIAKRMQALLDDANNKSDKPYRISISLGSVPFYKNGNDSVEELMARADALLYEQKRLKKSGKN